MENYLNNFCSTRDTKFLDKLDESTKFLLIDAAYSCLYQKYGNLELAKIILQYYGEIIQIVGTWVYKGSKNFQNGTITDSYQQLKRTGVTTIPVFYNDADLHLYQQKFQEILLTFPEYSRSPRDPTLNINQQKLIYVLGGFAAFGNPASFHNNVVRQLRIICRKRVLPLFQTLSKNSFRKLDNLEMLWDRMMYRYRGQTPSAETWHRDVIPGKKISEWDEVFGGWVNLDSESQYFSCILGSHLDTKLSALDEGFAVIPKKDVPTLNKHTTRIEVPPGHMIIFPQYIVHEVLGSAAKHNMVRLFLGWRLTREITWIHPDIPERVESQDIMKLPSGQLPAMYSKSHLMFYQNKEFAPIPNEPRVTLRTWSDETFIPPLRNTKNAIIPRFLDSLKEYNLHLYPKYNQEELDMYRPTNILNIL